MREIRTSGSVGAPGGQPPGATRWMKNRVLGVTNQRRGRRGIKSDEAG